MANELVGARFGGFVVTERAQAVNRQRRWKLRCETCGVTQEEAQVSLKEGFLPEHDCTTEVEPPDPFAWDEPNESLGDYASRIAVAQSHVDLSAVRKDAMALGEWSDELLKLSMARLAALNDAPVLPISGQISAKVIAAKNAKTEPLAFVETETIIECDDESPTDPFEAMYDEDDLQPEVTFAELPEGQEDPTPKLEPEAREMIAELKANLAASPWAKSNPVADAIDSIASALAELAKALRA